MIRSTIVSTAAVATSFAAATSLTVLMLRGDRDHHPPGPETATPAIAELGPGEVLLVEETLVPAVREAAPGCDVLPLGEEDRAGLAELQFDPRLAPREAAAEELKPLYLMGSYAE